MPRKRTSARSFMTQERYEELTAKLGIPHPTDAALFLGITETTAWRMREGRAPIGRSIAMLLEYMEKHRLNPKDIPQPRAI